jgi:hypothetical protein
VAYNDNLAHLRDIDKKLAEESKQPFANVHDAMYQAMQKAQEKLGNKYHVCGNDGFHPRPNGQIVMAYAFLKGLGVDGKIGEIKMNLGGADKKATVSEGHRAVGWNVVGSKYSADIESTRWPFCFDGDGASPESTRSITPFLPFNEDLNRLTLVVTGLDAAKARVTWGEVSKEFTKEQLAAGINLAAEFDKTPFDAAFGELVAAIGQKQNFETFMIKTVVTQFRSYPAELKADAELQAALKTVSSRLQVQQQALDAAARKLLVPVKHTLSITPL